MSQLIISKAIQDAFERYEAAAARVVAANRELSTASCALSNATNEFGRQMCPADAKTGESFSIWLISTLYTIEKIGDNDYEITKRAGGVVK